MVLSRWLLGLVQAGYFSAVGRDRVMLHQYQHLFNMVMDLPNSDPKTTKTKQRLQRNCMLLLRDQKSQSPILTQTLE